MATDLLKFYMWLDAFQNLMVIVPVTVHPFAPSQSKMVFRYKIIRMRFDLFLLCLIVIYNYITVISVRMSELNFPGNTTTSGVIAVREVCVPSTLVQTSLCTYTPNWYV